MAVQFLNATPGTADSAPAGAAKINANFAELYGNVRAAVKMFTFASVAAMVAAPYLQAGDTVLTQGYFAAGDGGTGLYRIVPPATGATDGGVFIDLVGSVGQASMLVLDTIEAAWYGLDPNGVTPCDVKLNAAIQVALNAKKELVLPNGIFLCNNPLFTFTSGSGQRHLDIRGQGSALAGGPAFPVGPLSGDYRANTILLFNYKDKPGIIYQNCRYSTLKKVSLMGLNSTAFNGPAIPSNNQSDYVGSGFATGAQSPNCGIAIDPFTVAVPPDGGYAGLGAYYGPTPSGNGSSGIRFEEVWISQFVVGVAESCASVSQGDEMSYVHCDIHFCDVAYACGNTQARGATFTGGSMANCRTLFDTLNYGNPVGSGCNPIVIDGVLVGRFYQLIALGSNGPTTLRGVYGESFSSIGLYGKGASPLSLLIEGCQLNLGTTQFAGKMPYLVLEASGQPVIRNTSIGAESAQDVFNFIGPNVGIGFEQCTFRGSGLTDVPPLVAVDKDATYGAKFQDCMCITGPTTFQMSDTSIRHIGIASLANGKGRYRATPHTRWVTDGITQYLYQPRSSVPNIGIGTTASITIVGTTLTFTLTTLGECQVNDILLWKMLPQGFSATSYNVPAWKIATIDGSGNCVANALFDITLYDTVANTAASFGANVVLVVYHQWAPTTALTGNTHSNTTLDGLSQSALINGDFVQGTGIPVKTRVVSGGGTASVVLSKAATSTLTGINLWDGQLLVAQEQTGAFFPFQVGNTGSAPAPAFANGARQAYTLNASATWGAPTGAWKVGDELTLMVTATGAFTTTWNAVYRGAPAWAVAANGLSALAKFIKIDATNWQFIGGSTGFA